MTPTSSSVIFSGTYERSLDAKKRVTVPSRWLSHEGAEFHCVLDPRGQFLNVLPPEEFAQVEQKLVESGLPAKSRQEFMRRFYGDSHLVSADKQGRLLLPEALCQPTDLKDQAVLVGTGRRFEIWNPNRWSNFHAKNEEEFQKIADEIGL